ncbi:hypothetical protein [Phormidium sp. FACHB-1136]|uniref:hypothetical protein n=1 Tax=Phormidium sp. FACHB-1136 TaxID=2692848 RepID=UPI001682FBC2|nr:hypothetical protein [Phormidium sp. FACHB-1136]MBD2426346.1 hypothetical protein [Phormidium sp. FACHB-1136]
MSHYLLIRIEALQQELEHLRQMVLQQTQVGPRSTQLQGLWRGVDVQTTIVQPTTQAPLLTLDLHPSTGHIG